MSKLKLYLDTLSQPCRSLLIFLENTKIPYEPIVVRLGKGEQNSPEFLKVNPLHQVPVIDDNGFILRESVAILRYLCREKKNVADHWYPKDSKKQAKVDEYLEWQHLGTRLGCGLYFRTLWLEPLATGKTPDIRDIQRCKTQMVTACDSIENHWLKNKYICGDEISIADILAASELEQPRLAGYDPRDGRPKLTEFMARVREATNPSYDEAHKIINTIVDKYKGQPPLKEKKSG
ncbi:glutathione S-transferase theta-1-like [Rhodnius prolixus]|uniref:glutathione transferase n=1 Tax=Rhodnius prolixus TaxID=13249 RepID=R4G3Y0_RHOPR